MAFTTDDNGIKTRTPAPTGDAGDALNSNFAAISGHLTALLAHVVSDTNPHNVTAAQVDAYTTAETDAIVTNAVESIDLSGYLSTLEASETYSPLGHTHLSAHITDATSSNTPDTIVMRGPSGAFAAGTLSVDGILTTAGTSAANGITFGVDTNLYRSTANQLKTDDSFWCASTLFANIVRASSATGMTLQSLSFPAAVANICQVPPTLTNTSGTSAVLSITPTYNQTSGTAANTDLLINRTQTAVGSGTQRLIDLQVGGSSRLNVDTNGVLTTASGIVLNSNGGIYGSGVYVTTWSTPGNNQTIAMSGRNFTSGGTTTVDVQGSVSNSSGTHAQLKITPTYTQTGTASATDLLVNRAQNSVGSGNQRLIDLQIGGTTQFHVSNAAVAFVGNASSVPSTNPVGGGYLYVEAGALNYRGSSGTVSVIAPA